MAIYDIAWNIRSQYQLIAERYSIVIIKMNLNQGTLLKSMDKIEDQFRGQLSFSRINPH